MIASGRHVARHRLAAVVATAATLVIAGLACSRAEASCGDWLEGHAPQPFTVNVSAIDATAAADGAAPLADPLRRPCRGPSCGGSPRLPTIPTEPPATPVEPERDAVLPVAAIVSCSWLASWIICDEPFSPSASADPAERPPSRG